MNEQRRTDWKLALSKLDKITTEVKEESKQTLPMSENERQLRIRLINLALAIRKDEERACSVTVK